MKRALVVLLCAVAAGCGNGKVMTVGGGGGGDVMSGGGSAAGGGSSANGGGASPSGGGTTSSGGGASSTGGGSASSGGGTVSQGGGASSTGGGSGTTPLSAADLVGVWQVAGSDMRGAYVGQAEVRASADGGYDFYRAIGYSTVTVENGRALNWGFIGTASSNASSVSLAVTLENRDFILSRGSVTRALTDPPIEVAGLVAKAGGTVSATYAGTSIDGNETWTNKTTNGTQPILVVDRVVIPSVDPPSPTTKSALFSAFASYQSLPVVMPYVNRPDFQAAIYGNEVDKTDFDFYRANPNTLRVINKAIDDVSTGETLSRANAFRNTLAAKAAILDTEAQSMMIDPTTGMIYDGIVAGQPPQPSFSACLWTGEYVASQAYRFEVTGDTQALTNLQKSLDGILKLQEITGDWTQFARAIRVATGDLTGGWHAGTGQYSSLEWLEGGNNDMTKGLYLAYYFGWQELCSGAHVNASLCSRIRTNAKHLSDDINVGNGSDELDSPWLVAVVTDNDAITQATYRAKAETQWITSQVTIGLGVPTYVDGDADWSGLNLNFVSNLYRMLFSGRAELGNNSKSKNRGWITQTYSNFRRSRLPLLAVLNNAYATTPDSQATDDFTWRMREFPAPKSQMTVDHRISPRFCMAPYPALPWKNDWTTTDRTQALNTYPLFETAMDVYQFRHGLAYEGDSAMTAHPSPEYLIAYWLARKQGLLGPSD